MSIKSHHSASIDDCPPARIVVTTAIAKNFLPFARVLAGSIRRFHPDLGIYVLLVDGADGRFDPAREPFEFVSLGDLAIPDLAAFRRRYSRKEIAAAAKPYLLEHVLARRAQAAVFLDPDILVLADLGDILDHVQRHAVTLTPHMLVPPGGLDRIGRETNVLLAGVYNAGFVGVSDRPSGRGFLAWWMDRVLRQCRHEVGRGRYFDQRWLDLAAVFFDDVSIIRDPACNVAYWNLCEREIRLDGERVLVDGNPCKFFHFSGFDPLRSARVTRYRRRLEMARIGAVQELYLRYGALLKAAGYGEAILWPYTHASPLRRAVEGCRFWAARAFGRRGTPWRRNRNDVDAREC